MKAKATSNGLEFLAWPALAWMTAWAMVPTALAAEPPRTQAPVRRRPKPPTGRRRARDAALGDGTNVLRFPFERVKPLAPQAMSRAAAKVLPLRSAS